MTGSPPPLRLPVLACLTLGLAPYLPMPHLAEKLIWLWQGRSFRTTDVFDLLLHGVPWIWLLVALIARLRGAAPAS
jgi:hypothetical protein